MRFGFKSFCLFSLLFIALAASASAQRLLKVKISSAIGPPVVTVFENVAKQAKLEKADGILVELDTPGGLAESMRQINQQILASDIPYILYVYPKGARAASAGTFMLYASHVAVMAPTTTLGAASPVSLTGGASKESNSPFDFESNKDDSNSNKQAKNNKNSQAESQSTMMKKVTNDAVASIRSLAKLRGRNADWAESAVRDAKSLSAKEALEKQVIDLVAEDETDLLKQLATFPIQMKPDSKPLTLAVTDVKTYTFSLKERFLMAVFNPNLLYVFILIGIYGIIFEFSSPGVGLPGVAGAICLALAGFGMQMLPLNAFGLVMIALGTVFLIVEVLSPSFGLFGSVGVVLLTLGGWFLIDPSFDGLAVSSQLVLAAGLANAFAVAFLCYVLYLTQKKAKDFVSLVGKQGRVMQVKQQEGFVKVDGERWQFTSSQPLTLGQVVQVVSQKGLLLHVETIH